MSISLILRLGIAAFLVNFGSAWVAPQTTSTRATRSALFSFFTAQKTNIDELEKVQEVVSLARKLGPVGAFCSEVDQERILQAARGLQKSKKPALVPLN